MASLTHFSVVLGPGKCIWVISEGGTKVLKVLDVQNQGLLHTYDVDKVLLIEPWPGLQASLGLVLPGGAPPHQVLITLEDSVQKFINKLLHIDVTATVRGYHIITLETMMHAVTSLPFCCVLKN
jgi:hypothetical protein